MKIKISRESEEILKNLKHSLKWVFVDAAIIYYSKTEEGKKRLEKWNKKDDREERNKRGNNMGYAPDRDGEGDEFGSDLDSQRYTEELKKESSSDEKGIPFKEILKNVKKEWG